jgi:hypothetical protein
MLLKVLPKFKWGETKFLSAVASVETDLTLMIDQYGAFCPGTDTILYTRNPIWPTQE